MLVGLGDTSMKKIRYDTEWNANSCTSPQSMCMLAPPPTGFQERFHASFPFHFQWPHVLKRDQHRQIRVPLSQRPLVRHRPAHHDPQRPHERSCPPLHTSLATLCFLLGTLLRTLLSVTPTHASPPYDYECLTAQAQASAACLQTTSPSLPGCVSFADCTSLCQVPNQRQHQDFLRHPKAELRLLTGNPSHTKLEMGTLVRFLCEAICSLTSYFKEIALSKERFHHQSKIKPLTGQPELLKHLD